MEASPVHQSRFEEAHRAEWQELERLLGELEQRSLSASQKARLERLPLLYRRVCGHYSLALRRCYTSGLTDQLHALILRGHRHIYKQRGQALQELVAFFHSTFPLRVRQAWRYVVFSLLMFYLPALILGWFSYQDATFIYSLMPPDVGKPDGIEQFRRPFAHRVRLASGSTGRRHHHVLQCR